MKNMKKWEGRSSYTHGTTTHGILPENNERLEGRSRKRMERWKINEKPKLRTEESRKDDDRRAWGKMQEKERPAPGLTKCDRVSQGFVFKGVLNKKTEVRPYLIVANPLYPLYSTLVCYSLAHPVYMMMTEQPAQSIPSDNYLEKSLILTAYRYNWNFYCLVIFAMLDRIQFTPPAKSSDKRYCRTQNRNVILLKFYRELKIPPSMSRPMSGYDGMKIKWKK